MRLITLSLAAVFALCGVAPVPVAIGDHARALAALADVRVAVAEIVRIEDGYAVGHPSYLRAAHRAMNALGGRRGDGYAPSFGDPGDGVGTLGHLDFMLDKAGTSLWTPAIEGAKANVLAAAQNLQNALGEKEMEDYQADLTRALANLALVVGRPSQSGVLGGISGALGTTALGVPAGAVSVSGCAPPLRAPSYGVVSGRLTFISLPRSAASSAVPVDLSVSRVAVRGEQIVLYTAAAREISSLCRVASRPAPARTPALYSAAQAHAGLAVYQKSCIQCHGANLQGAAGPAVAGRDFLASAKGNAWTLHDLRTTIFQNMPFSSPGSLTPAQYANVTAFLLASSCYPSGAKAFPTSDTPALAKVKLAPIAGVKPTNAKLGTCAVK